MSDGDRDKRNGVPEGHTIESVCNYLINYWMYFLPFLMTTPL